ncbi:hypothetical protein Ddye_024108 [Dipteronia dyeriana]|uniref:Uncharacterized protein n=1 Tax=Dipteronia dyeriana TaxID=168575 RepID=A0AAD9WU46_9ROSI|nr:hypothetical protein Ddye_024108 [Dipteronia dyeriana]
MDTRNKSNNDFRYEVTEILTRHESSFDQLNSNANQMNTAIQNVMAKLQTLQEFNKAVLLRSGPTDYEDPSEVLTRLKQVTVIEAYLEAIEKLSHRVDNLPKNFLVGCFIARLKDKVRLDVKLKHPKVLAYASGVARLIEIEERNSLQKKWILPSEHSILLSGHRPLLHQTVMFPISDETLLPHQFTN